MRAKHLSLNFDAAQWSYDFTNFTPHFTSLEARIKCLYERPISLNDMRQSLVDGRCSFLLRSYLFEEYAIRLVMRIFGVSRRAFDSPPTFVAAVPNVCYQSLDQRHPACVAILKQNSILHMVGIVFLLFCSGGLVLGLSLPPKPSRCGHYPISLGRKWIPSRPSFYQHSSPTLGADIDASFPLEYFRGDDNEEKKVSRANVVPHLSFAATTSRFLLNLFDAKALPCIEQGVVPILVSSNVSMPFDVQVSTKTLFVRPFYNDLIALIGRCHRAILMGSAGTGKSMFQHVLLYYLLTFREGYVVDPFGVSEGKVCGIWPKIILRQTGRKVTIYNLDRRLAYNCPLDEFYLEQFNPEIAVYFYEPLTFKEEPCIVPGLPSLITVSPDLVRYKEFQKSGSKTLVMPRYSLNELRSIGKYMLADSDHQDIGMKKYFDDASIIQRYRRHGGIFRRVLVSDASQIREHELQREQAIRDTNYWQCTNLNYPDDISASGSHIVQLSAALVPAACNTNPSDQNSDPASEDFNATQWTYDFMQREAHFSSDTVRDDLIAKSNAMSLVDMQRSLIKGANAGLLLPQIFEQYAIRLIKEIYGVHFHEKSLPTFSTALPDVCYQPPQLTFPACEAFFKKDSALYLIQASITQEDKICTNGAMASLLLKLNVTTEPSKGEINLIYLRKNEDSNWKPTIFEYTKDTTTEFKALSVMPWLKDIQKFRDAFTVTNVNFDGNWRPMMNGDVMRVPALVDPVYLGSHTLSSSGQAKSEIISSEAHRGGDFKGQQDVASSVPVDPGSSGVQPLDREETFWTGAEEKRLEELVQKHGHKWAVIKAHMGKGFTSTSCRVKYTRMQNSKRKPPPP